jgi:hypothetical protein
MGSREHAVKVVHRRGAGGRVLRTKEALMATRAKRVAALLFAICAFAVSAAPAFGDPSFGPGNSGSNGNQQCKPPGQTNDLPQCK